MHLTIQLLGAPQFQLDHAPVTASRRAVVALIAYLAVTEVEYPGQRHARESLASLFWTDYDLAKGLANLRHTLWEVSQFMGEGWIVTEHETISLSPHANFTLDIAQFHSSLRQAAQQTDPTLRIPYLVEAAKQYRDDFLHGFSLKDGSSFNDWVLNKAAALRHEFASLLEMLVEDLSTLQQPQTAIPYAQRLIELDSLNEAAQRRLMQLYALTDQQAAAIQQYRALEKLLRKELNVDPQLETYNLYKKIRKGEFKAASTARKVSGLEHTGLRHNLPAHLTSFIGREKERDEISRLLSQNRLVTLIGAGGIGKTRLAMQTGHSLLNDYPDGVWLIPLESLTDEDLVAPTVASLLGIRQSSEQTVMEALINELRSKNQVLILDNCEHLLDACAQLTETLLKHCPGIKVLTTSREALRLDGEAFYHLAPLSVPEHTTVGSKEDLMQYESVRLFLERAGLAGSRLEPTEPNLEAVVRICNRLDGIPLAIELAAAHVDIFTPEEILSQLNRSFDLLVSHTRSALSRHQTMHTSIDWGWNLLQESERVFMRRLSVFLGGWTLRSAQAMGISNGRELTSALVKKSFVVVHQQTAHETRYGFHEVIRSYAQEKLAEAGEERTIRDQHLEYFLELSRELEPALRGIDQETWLERLYVERDNIRAALEWAARTNVQAGLYLSNRLRKFWENYDLREEARWLLTI